MIQNSQSLESLVQIFSKMPGIGRKTAQRMAFHILKMPAQEVEFLIDTLKNVKDKVTYCSVCCNITETDPCQICIDEKRNNSPLIVVEDVVDVIALEKVKGVKYRYHVLNGRLSPLDGITPDDLRIKELVNRLTDSTIKEIIIATNPNVEGEATALYLFKLLMPFNIKITRIARGLPVGGDLEFSDEVTLTEALDGRRIMN